MALQAAPSGPLGQLFQFVGQFDDALAADVAHHRHQQPLVGVDGDADVAALSNDDLVGLLVDRGVQVGKIDQGMLGGLHEKGEKGQMASLVLDDMLLALLEGPQLGDVGLLHGGNEGRPFLGLHQVTGDGSAKAGEGDALIVRRRGFTLGPVPGRGSLEHVIAGDAAARTAPLHCCQVDPPLLGQHAGGGQGEHGLRWLWLLCWRLILFGLGKLADDAVGGPTRRLRFSLLAGLGDRHQHVAHLNRRTGGAFDAEHLAGPRRRNLDHRLVGLQFQHRLVLVDMVPLRNEPVADLRLGDAFAKIGQSEFIGHDSQYLRTSSIAFLIRPAPGM